jgi:hypothetical protein
LSAKASPRNAKSLDESATHALEVSEPRFAVEDLERAIASLVENSSRRRHGAV